MTRRSLYSSTMVLRVLLSTSARGYFIICYEEQRKWEVYADDLYALIPCHTLLMEGGLISKWMEVSPINFDVLFSGQSAAPRRLGSFPEFQNMPTILPRDVLVIPRRAQMELYVEIILFKRYDLILLKWQGISLILPLWVKIFPLPEWFEFLSGIFNNYLETDKTHACHGLRLQIWVPATYRKQWRRYPCLWRTGRSDTKVSPGEHKNETPILCLFCSGTKYLIEWRHSHHEFPHA